MWMIETAINRNEEASLLLADRVWFFFFGLTFRYVVNKLISIRNLFFFLLLLCSDDLIHSFNSFQLFEKGASILTSRAFAHKNKLPFWFLHSWGCWGGGCHYPEAGVNVWRQTRVATPSLYKACWGCFFFHLISTIVFTPWTYFCNYSVENVNY